MVKDIKNVILFDDWLNNVSLEGFATSCLSTCLSVNTGIGSTSQLSLCSMILVQYYSRKTVQEGRFNL